MDRVEREGCDATEDRGRVRHSAKGVRRAIFNAILGARLSGCAHRIVDVFRNGGRSQLKALLGASCPTSETRFVEGLRRSPLDSMSW